MLLRKLGMWMLEQQVLGKSVYSAFSGMVTGLGREKRMEVANLFSYLGYYPIYEGNDVRGSS